MFGWLPLEWWKRLRLFMGLAEAWTAAQHAAEEAEGTMDPKSIFLSWTFWFNLLAAVYVVLQNAGVLSAIPAPWDALALTLGNILLRLKTSQPVTLLGAKSRPIG